MRMHLLVAATLAAAGCSEVSTGDCDAMQEDFTLDPQITAARLKELLTEFGATDPAELDCDAVCTSLYRRGDKSSWEVIVTSCTLSIADDAMGDPAGTIACDGEAAEYYCLGRRPLGHIEHSLADAGLPTFLAHCARLEAASVLAFSQLADRLQRWGAPAALIARCRQAAAEEAEHAEILGALASEAGATVLPATQRDIPVDIAAAARDNAIEGCVHEAWSALSCAVTARRAATPALRAAFTRLAADEAEHAQLAWDLHTWFLGQVTTYQRSEIVAAQRAAIAGLPALARAQSRAAPPALALPDGRLATRFAIGLARAA
ncbi:MAG: ferritin-like domain-containing protein [Nannocystis sp.]|uniref:ferritin-like domain-containing protein n=1 Tax=Nannocystis sp. TaxID=1962667 RepID=UPI00242617CD|nr:ferritin-like domain-containing protein [Nannocystis sp.]MBK9753545.1 ferritin-like domain-containing protein [Nannocystis sp.]